MSFNTFIASYSQSDFKLNGYLKNVFNFLSPRKGTLKAALTLQSTYINADEFMSSETTNTAAANSTKENPTKSTTSTGVIIIPKNLDLQFKAIAQKVDFQEFMNGRWVGFGQQSIEYYLAEDIPEEYDLTPEETAEYNKMMGIA